MNGILNINKPPGSTSFSIVALIKRLTKERRVGHGGTLDPMATGVLPICLGKATRVMEYLTETTKTYQAKVKLGITTDTYDATGKIIKHENPSGITRENIISTLRYFRGQIEQIPPMYSALKHNGIRLYKLARAQITVRRKHRLVQIHRLELTDWQPPELTLEIDCGKGTYIRSLAHDIGQFLGCGACLTYLARLRYGPFHVEESVSVSQLKSVNDLSYLRSWLSPLDAVLTQWPVIILTNIEANTIGHGQHIEMTEASRQVHLTESRYRAYTHDGTFLATLRINNKHQLYPEKVFI